MFDFCLEAWGPNESTESSVNTAQFKGGKIFLTMLVFVPWICKVAAFSFD